MTLPSGIGLLPRIATQLRLGDSRQVIITRARQSGTVSSVRGQGAPMPHKLNGAPVGARSADGYLPAQEHLPQAGSKQAAGQPAAGRLRFWHATRRLPPRVNVTTASELPRDLHRQEHADTQKRLQAELTRGHTLCSRALTAVATRRVLSAWPRPEERMASTSLMPANRSMFSLPA